MSIVLAMLAGCGEREYEPYSIAEGVDICNTCNMIVPNDLHATQIILKDGHYFMFDDIGCHYNWLSSYDNERIAVQFVRDFHTEEWIVIEEATFVYDVSFRTPMSYGILSFQSLDEAKDFIGENGKGTIFSYDEFHEHHWKAQRQVERYENLVGTKWGGK